MGFTIFYIYGFLDPVSQVPHKVKEEVAVRHADDLEVSEGFNCVKKIHVEWLQW